MRTFFYISTSIGGGDNNHADKDKLIPQQEDHTVWDESWGIGQIPSREYRRYHQKALREGILDKQKEKKSLKDRVRGGGVAGLKLRLLWEMREK